MFFNIILRRVLLQQNGIYSNFPKKVGTSVSFGDPRMPDKLYESISLEIRSYEPAVMKSYENFITKAANHLNVSVESIISKPKPKHDRMTLLKSVFVHRKALVQYEVRTYYTWINLKHLTGSTADTFLEYIERMLPEGVALKVTKVEVEPMPSHLSAKSVKESSETSSSVAAEPMNQ